MTEPLLLTVRQAVPVTGVGRDSLYRLVAEGRIRTVRVGAKRLIPRTELERWIERELMEGGDPVDDTASGNGRGPHPTADGGGLDSR